MKLKFTAIAILSLIALSACNNGTRDWQKFQKKYASDGVSFRLNGLMKWMASGIISKETGDPEAQAVAHILKNMKSIEVNIIPRSKASYSEEEVVQLSQKLNHSSYQSLINIQKGNQLFNLWARGNQDEFSDPLALINYGNNVIMVEMKGTLTAKDIQMLTNAGMKYSDSNVSGEQPVSNNK